MEQDTADRALDMVESFAAKLEALAIEIGPEVGELALAAARVDALSYIFPQLLIVMGLLCIAPKIVRFVIQWEARAEGSGKGNAYLISALTIVLFLVVSLIGKLWSFLSVWPWVGLYEPKLWIAYKILEL